MDAQKSMREDPALKIGTDLSLDKASNRRTPPLRSSQEGLELFANDLMQKSLLGFVVFVSDGGKQSTGTLGETALPDIASDMPKLPWRCDDSDATDQPRVRVRCFSVLSNDFHIEATGSRVWTRGSRMPGYAPPLSSCFYRARTDTAAPL